MERISALPWEEIDKATDKSFVEASQKELQKELDGAEVKIETANTAGEPAAKSVAVSIRWQDKDNQWVQPVRLAAWRYRR
jgi:hypothetical protein